MVIFTQAVDKHGMERIRATPTYGESKPVMGWPRIYTWETEDGQVAIIKGHDHVLLIDRGLIYVKPNYVVDVMIDIYGTPNEMVGFPAISYLYNRFS